MKPPSAAADAAFSRARTDDPAHRETHDFYPTWPQATRALCTVERFDGPIWEPACGDGAMVRELERAGHRVIATDLIDRGQEAGGWGEGGRDFLMEWQPLAPHIVTNPPFTEAQDFVDRALMLTAPERTGSDGGKVVMFLRLAFLAGQKRGLWWPGTPLARVWVMSRRVPMQRGRLATEEDSGGVLDFAWYVWEHGHQGPPALHWLDWRMA